MIVLILLFGIHLSIIFFLGFWMWKKQSLELRPYFWPAFVMKLSAGIGLGLLYKYHYAIGDTFGFFDDGKILASTFWDDPFAYFNFIVASDERDPIWSLLNNTQSRSLFLVKIVSGINILTANNYWLTSLYFSGVSFWSAFYLFRKMATLFSEAKLSAAMAFLFFPSVVFWSSGIIKESLAMAGLFMLSGIYISLVTNLKPLWWEWLIAMLSIILVWNLKYYWVAVFIPVAATTLFVHTVTRNLKWRVNYNILIWLATFLIGCFGVTLVHPNFYLENFLEVLVNNYNEFIRISPSENVVHYQLEPNWWSVVLNSPLALASGFFRPFIWEGSNFLQRIVSIENFLVLMLFASACVRIHAIWKSPYRLLIGSCLVYVLLLCLFLSLSTPNLGTLARYKVGFQPFLIFILLVDNFILDWLKVRFNQFFSKKG